MFDLTFVVHAAAEGEAVNPLSFDLWTFLFQLINVAIVLVALYYMLFRPLGNMIRAREEKVARTLDEASDARERAAELEARYDQKLKEAQREIQRMMEEAQQAPSGAARNFSPGPRRRPSAPSSGPRKRSPESGSRRWPRSVRRWRAWLSRRPAKWWAVPSMMRTSAAWWRSSSRTQAR